MTEEKPESPDTETPEAEKKYFIEVRGQKVEIGRSTPEQLAMMRVTGNRLARLNPDTMTSEDVIRAYEKVIQVVTSLPVDLKDREWFEDLLVSKEMELEEASDVMDKASQAWAEGGNRAERRAAKATRRRPTAARK
jgi:hypothetical protein